MVRRVLNTDLDVPLRDGMEDDEYPEILKVTFWHVLITFKTDLVFCY